MRLTAYTRGTLNVAGFPHSLPKGRPNPGRPRHGRRRDRRWHGHDAAQPGGLTFAQTDQLTTEAARITSTMGETLGTGQPRTIA